MVVFIQMRRLLNFCVAPTGGEQCRWNVKLSVQTCKYMTFELRSEKESLDSVLFDISRYLRVVHANCFNFKAKNYGCKRLNST